MGIRQTLPDGSVAGAGDSLAAYTPLVSATSGAITASSAAGRYKAIGKTFFVRIRATVTTNGTGAGAVLVTLPFSTPNDEHQTIQGMESALTGKALRGYVAKNGNTIQLRYQDDTYPGANGATYLIEGWLESQ